MCPEKERRVYVHVHVIVLLQASLTIIICKLYRYAVLEDSSTEMEIFILYPSRESDRRRVSVFEVSTDGQTRCLVKEYVRAGAGHEVPRPSELRPPAVLMKTLSHLIDKYIGACTVRKLTAVS